MLQQHVMWVQMECPDDLGQREMTLMTQMLRIGWMKLIALCLTSHRTGSMSGWYWFYRQRQRWKQCQREYRMVMMMKTRSRIRGEASDKLARNNDWKR